MRITICFLTLFGMASAAHAQPASVPSQRVPNGLASGVASAPAAGAAPVVVFSQNVSVAGAPWVHLRFGQVRLSGSPTQGNAAFLRITSLQDAAVQNLDASALNVWRNTSAYFNGDTVLLELLAYPGAGENWVVVDEVLAGLFCEGGATGGGAAGVDCALNDRVPSSDPRTGRVFYAVPGAHSACTAFLFNSLSNCLLTAGHCCSSFDFATDQPVMEFNVPLSTPNGCIRHPPPEHQYPVDGAAVAWEGDLNSVPGNDWCRFGVFSNTTTSLSPLDAQDGRSYRLAPQTPLGDGSVLRMTGYGITDPPSELNVAQQTATGAYLQRTGTKMSYTIYAIGGTSGSAVEHECRGLVYGINTHGGCQIEHANVGTTIDHPNLQNALANPQGVCALLPDCNNNGRNDACDISCAALGCSAPCGTSADCSANGTPDECEDDCNSNGVADSCDILSGFSTDQDLGGIPDECQPSVFVKADATGLNNGTSWQSAFVDLQDALTNSPDPCGRSIKRVWLAAGTYKPDRGTGNRATSFSPARVTAIYGGFAGNETRFQDRNPATNVTILSGDIGVSGSSADNSYHVVSNPFITLVALDGFRISSGRADGTSSNGVGGGLFTNGNPVVSRCVFCSNHAVIQGGGVLSQGNPKFTNCLFLGNTTDSQGAGFANSGGAPALIDCTLANNQATLTGGGMATFAGTPTLSNCILWGNSANGQFNESGQFYKSGGTPSINYSCLQGWTGLLGGTGNIEIDPRFIDAVGPDNIIGTEDDNLRLSVDSPGIDAGDNSAVLSGVTTDLDGRPRFLNDRFTTDTGLGTAPIVDMGAYEFFPDCNNNGVYDDDDVLSTTSLDNNGNGIPDECEPPPTILWNADPLSTHRTTRSLRFQVEAAGTATGTPLQSAIKVMMVDLQHPVPANLPAQAPPNFTTYDTRLNGVCNSGTLVGHHCDADADCPPGVVVGRCSSMVACTAAGEENGCARWIGKPGAFLESQDAGPSGGTYIAARLQCTPFYYNWTTEGLIAVVGAEIAPSSEYSIQTYGTSCMGAEASCTNVSPAVTMYTRRSGDAAPNFNPPSTTGQPDALDVTAVVNKLRNLPGALSKVIVQLQPNLPQLNANVNALDIVAVVDAVRGLQYGFSGPCPCPSAVICGSTPCTSSTVCSTTYGAGSMCVITCTGGDNDGEPCINDTHGHCPGGKCFDRECSGGPNAGQPCITVSDCSRCDGGNKDQLPCNSNEDCEGGICPVFMCLDIANTAFCRDRCGRCTP